MLAGIFLHPQVAEAFKKFPSDEWVRAAEEAGLGITTVRPPGEALADKSFLADGCVVEVDDPEEGLIRHVGPLLEFSATPGSVAGPAPRSGQHTDEILAEALSGGGPCSTAASPEPLAHPLEGIRSSIWGSASPGRSRGVPSPTSAPTSSRSTRCTTSIGTARTWVSA